jgi:hypothetical protein
MKTDRRYVAQEYVASSPEAEVSGSVLLSLFDNLKADEIRPILGNYVPCHEEVDVNGWYPQQALLDICEAIAERKVHDIEALVAIGVKIVDSLPFTPEIQTVEQAVAFFSTLTKKTHRNIPDAESLLVVETHPGRRVVVVNNTPYPFDSIFGALWAVAWRFVPAGVSYTVRHVENPNPDDFPGTAFEITWG